MTRDKDRRQEERKREHLALEFHYAQERSSVQTLDVSKGGALLSTPVMFPSGTLFILECPSLCAEGGVVRLLARVVRATKGFADRHSLNGVGVAWVRAYCATGHTALRDFLVDKLGYTAEEAQSVHTAATGDAVFDFPKDAQPPQPGRPEFSEALASYQGRRERLVALQKGRYRLDVPIIYSVHNMHYRGTIVALDQSGLAIATRGALPFNFSKVSVRYPLDEGPTAPRIVLFGETELVLEPFGEEPGYFSARLTGLDELDSPGVFRTHMRGLAARLPRW
jgi:hypothetical protein